MIGHEYTLRLYLHEPDETDMGCPRPSCARGQCDGVLEARTTVCNPLMKRTSSDSCMPICLQAASGTHSTNKPR
eukprot:6382582-Amphidinium_carterae.3